MRKREAEPSTRTDVRKSTLENVRRQIPAPRAAKWAIGNGPRVRHRLHGCGNVLLTAFADWNEGTDADSWAMEPNTL